MILLEVNGIPAPQGSKRGFVVGNRAVIVDDNKPQLRTWRQDVIGACQSHRVDEDVYYEMPLADALSVHLTFWLPRPKSAPKSRTEPTVKPDLDKLVRSTLDALKIGRIYCDDSQVVLLTAAKHYLPTDRGPGATITVAPA